MRFALITTRESLFGDAAPAAHDSPAVARRKAAGAAIIGLGSPCGFDAVLWQSAIRHDTVFNIALQAQAAQAGTPGI